jgi:hypothetical protein
MNAVRWIFIYLFLALASGCTTVNVRPVDAALPIKHICITNCEAQCYDGSMPDVIRDGFARHGITAQVYDGLLPAGCEYHLTYYCERDWDLAMIMTHAEVRLHRGSAEIGYAEYHLIGKGGFSLMKYQSTRTKMDPVIDELLPGRTALRPRP